MNENYNQPDEKERKRTPVWLIVVLAAVGIAAFFFTPKPKDDFKEQQLVKSLRADSVALYEDCSPVGKRYTYTEDLISRLDALYDAGNPTRFNHEDSAWIFSNEATASLARHNTEKCRQVLGEVLPQYRRAYASILEERNYPEMVCKTQGDADDVICILSPRYLHEADARDACTDYWVDLKELGFRRALLGFSVDSRLWEYEIQ